MKVVTRYKARRVVQVLNQYIGRINAMIYIFLSTNINLLVLLKISMIEI